MTQNEETPEWLSDLQKEWAKEFPHENEEGPTPEEIQERIKEVQSKWSDNDREVRFTGPKKVSYELLEYSRSKVFGSPNKKKTTDE